MRWQQTWSRVRQGLKKKHEEREEEEEEEEEDAEEQEDADENEVEEEEEEGGTRRGEQEEDIKGGREKLSLPATCRTSARSYKRRHATGRDCQRDEQK